MLTYKQLEEINDKLKHQPKKITEEVLKYLEKGQKLYRIMYNNTIETYTYTGYIEYNNHKLYTYFKGEGDIPHTQTWGSSPLFIRDLLLAKSYPLEGYFLDKNTLLEYAIPKIEQNFERLVNTLKTEE